MVCNEGDVRMVSALHQRMTVAWPTKMPAATSKQHAKLNMDVLIRRATTVAARYLGLDCHLILRTSKALVDKDPGLVGE